MFNHNPFEERDPKEPISPVEGEHDKDVVTPEETDTTPPLETPTKEQEPQQAPPIAPPPYGQQQQQGGWQQPWQGKGEDSYSRTPQQSGWQPPTYQRGSYPPPQDYRTQPQQQPPYQPNNTYGTPPPIYGSGQEQGKTTAEPYQWNLNDYQSVQPPKKKRSKGLVVFGSMLAVLLVCSIVGAGIYGFSSLPHVEEPSVSDSTSNSSVTSMPNISIQSKPEIQNSTSNANGLLSSVEIARKVKPSVVGIQTYTANGFGIYGEGSGIIMTADGYVVTNAHVVENSQGIKVILDNDEVYAAEKIGADTQSDLAVLKINAENLAHADFGNSDQVEVGEKILAIGNPAGMELAGSVTQGIVSAINRNIKTESGYNTNYIQVDAAINPGNSGGALVNEYGQVIGINSSKIAATDYEGIGFAIPINEVMEIVQDLIEHGRVTGRAVLGFTGVAIDSVDARQYGVPQGIQIMEISPTSDFINYNIVPGDIITKLDGVDIVDFASVRDVLAKHKPGDRVDMVVCRRNAPAAKEQYLEFKVKLIEDVDTAQIK